jgi:hypothetical protein
MVLFLELQHFGELNINNIGIGFSDEYKRFSDHKPSVKFDEQLIGGMSKSNIKKPL